MSPTIATTALGHSWRVQRKTLAYPSLLAFLAVSGVSVSGLALAAGAGAAQDPIILRCIGHGKGTGDDTVQWYVVIRGTKGEIGDLPAEMKTSSVSYDLDATTLHFPVDRTSGSFDVTERPFRSGNQPAVAWSKPEDPGCFRVQQRF
jgi:hypothetical protein